MVSQDSNPGWSDSQIWGPVDFIDPSIQFSSVDSLLVYGSLTLSYTKFGSPSAVIPELNLPCGNINSLQ